MPGAVILPDKVENKFELLPLAMVSIQRDDRYLPRSSKENILSVTVNCFQMGSYSDSHPSFRF